MTVITLGGHEQQQGKNLLQQFQYPHAAEPSSDHSSDNSDHWVSSAYHWDKQYNPSEKYPRERETETERDRDREIKRSRETYLQPSHLQNKAMKHNTAVTQFLNSDR